MNEKIVEVWWGRIAYGKPKNEAVSNVLSAQSSMKMPPQKSPMWAICGGIDNWELKRYCCPVKHHNWAAIDDCFSIVTLLLSPWCVLQRKMRFSKLGFAWAKWYHSNCRTMQSSARSVLRSKMVSQSVHSNWVFRAGGLLGIEMERTFETALTR